MKNQYYGDLNDYKKYSLLRHLTGNGTMSSSVCWVLTYNDELPNGRRITYLEKPEIWERYDPVVFSKLSRDILVKGERNISNIEDSEILRNCTFYAKYMEDDAESRKEFFSDFQDFLGNVDLVFFDPDNGLEVKSTPKGKRGSSRYIYWDEVISSFESGSSIFVYQHFPRKDRKIFISALIEKIRKYIGVERVYTYSTFHVLFLLIPQPRHIPFFRERNVGIHENWGDVIKIVEHDLLIKNQISATTLQPREKQDKFSSLYVELTKYPT